MKITLTRVDVGDRIDSDSVYMTVDYTIGDSKMVLTDKGRYNIRTNVYHPDMDEVDNWDEYESLQEKVEARG